MPRGLSVESVRTAFERNCVCCPRIRARVDAAGFPCPGRTSLSSAFQKVADQTNQAPRFSPECLRCAGQYRHARRSARAGGGLQGFRAPDRRACAVGHPGNHCAELGCRNGRWRLQAPLSMNLEARVTTIWRKQKLFIAVFLIGFGAYFFFDGAIAWPRSNERFLKHQEFRDADNLAGWTAYAKERGWSHQTPEKLYKQDELQAQFVYAAICVVLGLVAFGYWLQQVGRTIKLDDEAVTSPARTRIPFDSIDRKITRL